jgi:hypothetical protein
MNKDFSYYKVGLDDLFQGVKTARHQQFEAKEEDRLPLASEEGFHIYAEFDLNLKISAAEDDSGAQTFLNIVEDLAHGAVAVAGSTNIRLVEVQSDKLHFFQPSSGDIEQDQEHLIRFATTFSTWVQNHLVPKSENAWEAFRMAADFGPTIFLNSIEQDANSIVSLSVAANRPAKRLSKVSSWHLDYNARPESLDWVTVSLQSDMEKRAHFFDSALNEKLASSMEREVVEASRRAGIKYASAREFFESMEMGTVDAPMRLTAFVLRADLDGFTREVASAFSRGNEAVLELASRFRRHMLETEDLRSELSKEGFRNISMPWAGDCATSLFFAPDQFTYEESRLSLPFDVALKWHLHFDESFSDAKWAVGLAGGGEAEGDGVVLLADITPDGRRFKIVAGWGVRRSLDAQQHNGLNGTETCIPNADYQSLDSPFQPPFKQDGTYWKATLKGMKRAKESHTDSLAAAAPNIIVKGKEEFPSPKPYHNENWR